MPAANTLTIPCPSPEIDDALSILPPPGPCLNPKKTGVDPRRFATTAAYDAGTELSCTAHAATTPSPATRSPRAVLTTGTAGTVFV